MRLKVAPGPVAVVDVEIDDYIPLQVQLRSAAEPVSLYYRVRSKGGALLELGFSMRGAFRSAVLVTLGQEVPCTSDEERWEGVSEGLPQVDVSLWGDSEKDFGRRFIDDPRAIRAVLGAHWFGIEFASPDQPHRWLGTDVVRFRLDSDEALTGIAVRLRPEQAEQIRRTLDAQKA